MHKSKIEGEIKMGDTATNQTTDKAPELTEKWHRAQIKIETIASRPNLEEFLKIKATYGDFDNNSTKSYPEFARAVTNNTSLMLDPAASSDTYIKQFIEINHKASFLAAFDAAYPVRSGSPIDFLERQQKKIQAPDIQKLLGKDMVEKLSSSIDQAQKSGGVVDLGELLDTQIIMDGEIRPEAAKYFRDKGILDSNFVAEDHISKSSRAGVTALLEKHNIEPTSDRVSHMAANLDANVAIEMKEFFPEKPVQKAVHNNESENTANEIEMGSKL